MCVCVCVVCMFKHISMVCMCMCVQTGMCMCVYVHVSPRLTLGLFPVHSSPYIWSQALWLELELALAVRMTSKLAQDSVSISMCWAHRQASPSSPSFPMGLEIRTRVLTHGKHFTLQASPQGYVLFCMFLGLCCAVSPNTWFFP